MQEHADRLLSQASEIGLSVLSKASTFWKEGKERVVKVYEERATTTTTTGQKERADGRPKWMKDGGVGSSRDDEVEDVGHLKAKERRISKPYQEPVQQVRRQDKSTELKSELNFSGTGLSEPARRRTPNREIPAPSSQVAVTETATPPFTLPTRDRLLPSAPSSSLSSVDKYRTTGSSQFKLGQYASAIDSYSAAIGSLPPGHLLLLPLFNNRALARMRTGEYKAAADDAAQALGIVLVNAGTSDEFDPHAKESAVQVTMSSWLPSMEPSFLLIAAQQRANNGGWAHPQGFGVDLADGYVKALHRRAEACEGRERWSEALKLWEVLSASDPAWTKEHLRKEAQRSAARCRKMIADEASASKVGEEAPKPKQRPPATKPATISAAASAPSAALRSLQASNAEAEAEDNLKHELKDSVDSKLALWRTGKETNIRALLASLDMVLWEELLKGTRVVGLHELVTPVQVKKGYIKAIARVHPDKVIFFLGLLRRFGRLTDLW
jgi:tetratricopeptide (TPR) repeat protein